MRRREFLSGAAALAPVLAPAAIPVIGSALSGCAPAKPPGDAGAGGSAAAANDRAFTKVRDRYFVETLELNPVVSTYLGGDGVSERLASTNGRLRDFSAGAIQSEVSFLKAVRSDLAALDPHTLSPMNRIDHAVVGAQVDFVLHMVDDRRFHERSVETYASEPFRGVDWHMQQMEQGPGGMLGNEHDWQLLAERVGAIPAFLDTARANLVAGRKSGNIPDRRMVRYDGIDPAKSNATYFREELPALARRVTAGRDWSGGAVSALGRVGARAADAYAAFATFLETSFDLDETVDRYAAGEEEYGWRIRRCLALDTTPADVFELGAKSVAELQERMFAGAEEVARFTKLPLPFGTAAEKRASTRAVLDSLEKDNPKNDEELFRWYRETIARAVEYGRERKLFDVPSDYKIDVVATPESLGGENGGASYYPAPPFKKSGVGRFYLSPTRNDPAELSTLARAEVADTAIHEGFPGHDWNYKWMTRFEREITGVRWLTPGAVEDCFSMWEDSIASEGWALYAEALMAEPSPGRPHGFYSPAENLFQLEGQLFRAARVRVDSGIHTGRMTFDEGVDYFLENVSFRSGVRAAAAAGDPKAAVALRGSARGIYRYSKWPTQAITYELGKRSIEGLEARARTKQGAAFDARKFREAFMKMGTIPPGLFGEELLARL